MDKFGLIGHPIAHSLSPRLFTAAYDGRYEYDLIETPVFEEAWERFMKSYKAINITAPFKLDAYRKADIVSDEVRSIGAANILVKTENGIAAHNSDYLGVRFILKKAMESLDGDDAPVALIVGYGGAGMAAAQAAKDLGMDVTICNRSTDKAPGLRPLEEIPILAEVADILIYNLPVAIPEMQGVKVPVILEANYKDPCLGPEYCTKYIPGTEWHLMQAVEGYELMCGEKPDIEKMREIYRK